jgi:hypothetical protein
VSRDIFLVGGIVSRSSPRKRGPSADATVVDGFWIPANAAMSEKGCSAQRETRDLTVLRIVLGVLGREKQDESAVAQFGNFREIVAMRGAHVTRAASLRFLNPSFMTRRCSANPLQSCNVYLCDANAKYWIASSDQVRGPAAPPRNDGESGGMRPPSLRAEGEAIQRLMCHPGARNFGESV